MIMTLEQALLVAVVQGVTEFLPISSSAHLSLLEHLFGISEPQTAFDLALHFGTLVAVLTYFHKEVYALIRGFLSWAYFYLTAKSVGKPPNWAPKVLSLVLVASLPTAAIGLFFGPTMEEWSSRPRITGLLLVLNGLMLISTFRLKGQGLPLEGFTPVKAFFVGLAQGIGIFRGISRSGATIVSATHLGLTSKDAALFSFLLFIPAVTGGLALELRHGWPEGAFSLRDAVAATFVSFVVGLLALRSLMAILKRGRLYVFGPYCIVIGLLAIMFGG